LCGRSPVSIVAQATGTAEYGWAAGLSLLAISLGVPLMRALTEVLKHSTLFFPTNSYYAN
jgi:hypothetical protein